MTEPISQETDSGDSWSRNAGWAALGIIVAATLFRFWYCTKNELVGDEAYYWLCSRHLDLSFFDKGPGAATVIAMGTRLFGDSVFGVRFFAVILSMVTGLALYRLAAMLFDAETGFRAVLMAVTIPMLAVGSVLMTIDPISVFFWAAAAISFWSAVKKESFAGWLITGVFIGLGALAKYTNLMELVCFALFLGWEPSMRRWFSKVHFIAMLGMTVLVTMPMWIWNARHGWVTVGHLLHRGAVDEHWRVRPEELLSFLGQQAGVISPLIFAGIMWAVFRPVLSKTKPLETKYLASLFLPLFVMYSVLSLGKAGQPNWTAPAYVSGIVLLAASWPEMMRRGVWVEKTGVLALCLAALETILLHDTYWLHLPPGKDPLDRVRGFAGVALQADLVGRANHVDFYISNKYADAGLLAFYLQDKPDTFMPTPDSIGNQFGIWPGYLDRYKQGATGLFVADSDEVPPALTRDFATVIPLGEYVSYYRKRNIKKFHFYLCRSLQHPAFSPSK